MRGGELLLTKEAQMLMKKCPLCKVFTLLAAIGAINWGLVALSNLNLVTKLLGEGTQAAKIAYILVGLSGVVLLIGSLGLCPGCKGSCGKD